MHSVAGRSRSYRPLPPTSAGSGGIHVVDDVVFGGAAGADVPVAALWVSGVWKSDIASSRITCWPALTTNELAVTV